MAGELKLLYLYLSDIQNNIFPDTADLAEDGGQLNRLGLIYLNRQPKPATASYYLLSITTLAGATLRQGLTFKANDDSLAPTKLFILDSEYVTTGTNDYIMVRSLDTGLDNKLNLGDLLTVTEPVIGLENECFAFATIALPISSESIDDFRQAIIDATQLEPQGGSKTDLVLWAKDAQGVRKVYPFVKENNAGVVQIFVEATKTDSIDGKGTPSAFLLSDVEDVIEINPFNNRARRPIQMILEIKPIELIPVDVEIISLNQNSVDITSKIRANLEEYLYDVRPFIAGADLSRNKNDILNIARLQGISADSIGNTNYFLDIKMFVDGPE